MTRPASGAALVGHCRPSKHCSKLSVPPAARLVHVACGFRIARAIMYVEPNARPTNTIGISTE